MYYVIFFTGICPGELISLTWNDIDFNKKRIAVYKTIVRGKIVDVKTQSSVRYVDIILVLENKLHNLYKETGTKEYLLLSNFNKPFIPMTF